MMQSFFTTKREGRGFGYVDYGHKSILDMVPLSINIEGVSIILVELLWGMVHTGGGQETSTRYCKMSADSMWTPRFANADHERRWRSTVEQSMQAYEKACEFWRLVADTNPSVMGIKPDTPEKKAVRLKNNFVFDRARYAIPVACLTSMNITTWGSEWVKIVSSLNSSPMAEAQELAKHLTVELKLGAPRLVRHTAATSSACAKWTKMLDVERSLEVYAKLSRQVKEAVVGVDVDKLHTLTDASSADVRFRMMDRDYAALDLKTAKECLEHRTNRYDPVGSPVDEMAVRYGWSCVANAEIRDMNRHRPGRRHTDFTPQGFYFALDQILEHSSTSPEIRSRWCDLVSVMGNAGVAMQEMCVDVVHGKLGNPWDFLYSTTLGTEFSFTHTSTMGHLIYECELRTGPGVHYRYSRHYNDLIDVMIDKIWPLDNLILRGSSEPE
jgi:thymidylate synthase ThyX